MIVRVTGSRLVLWVVPEAVWPLVVREADSTVGEEFMVDSVALVGFSLPELVIVPVA